MCPYGNPVAGLVVPAVGSHKTYRNATYIGVYQGEYGNRLVGLFGPALLYPTAGIITSFAKAGVPVAGSR